MIVLETSLLHENFHFNWRLVGFSYASPGSNLKLKIRIGKIYRYPNMRGAKYQFSLKKHKIKSKLNANSIILCATFV